MCDFTCQLILPSSDVLSPYSAAVAACLPEIIPELTQVMVDMKKEVKDKSTETMANVATCVGNIDIDPFIPTLIECINNVDEVPECVHKLAATTFVQQAGANSRPLLSSTWAVSNTLKHPTHPEHPLLPP